MKIIKTILIGSFLLLWFGCTENDVAFFPINQVTTAEMMASPEMLATAAHGNYAYFRNWRTQYGYDRNRYDCKEYTSDDLIMMRWSGNHFSYTLTYQPTPISQRARDLWQYTYQAIYAINVVVTAIEQMSDAEIQKSSVDLKQILGENLWMRAMFHFDLATVFARPYSHDSPETNLGIILLDKTTDMEGLPRSSVKETYQFIEKNLLKAAELMHVSRPNIFASKEVAYATLARLYLYMEQNEKAIEYADKVINSGRYELVKSEIFPKENTLGPERNPETIFAVKVRPEENKGRNAVGTMMHNDGGWGEIMASTSYLDLLNKNKNDLRWGFIDPDFKLDENGNKIPDPDNPYYGYAMNDRMGATSYFQTKMTYEYDLAMLHSPVYFRLAEMYLIKAEAFAKTGKNKEALDMVNVIRTRAGLSDDQLFRLDNMQGYTSVLDIVLDEKRLEFAWEAHRTHDVFRNKRTMDRSYLAWQGWSGPSSIPYTSNRIVHMIPEDEITKNPNLVQNPSWTE